MIYLLLAIVSSMLVTVLMRISEKHVKNNISMLAMNYLMCTLLALLFSGSMQIFPKEEGLALTLGLGVIGGFLYLAGFVLMQWNISHNGMVLPATFMKLGVLVPTLLSILAFGETPRVVQVLGIAGAIAAILILQGKGDQKTGSIWGLIALLLAGGSADAMSKVFEEIAPASLKNQFLLYIFFVALVLCIALCLVRKQKLSISDALFGLAIGIPNYLSSRFLLLSLSDIPAVVAYPSFSVGTIVLVTVIGLLFFKEKLSLRKGMALGVILISLVLLNA